MNQEENVKVTLNFLLSQRLAEMINEDEILMTRGESMTGSESSSANRVRKYRERKKIEENTGKALECNTDVTLLFCVVAIIFVFAGDMSSPALTTRKER